MTKGKPYPPEFMNSVDCPSAEHCGGCDFIGTSYKTQLENKLLALKNLLPNLPEPEILSIGPWGQRVRLDFTLQQGALGLYRKMIDGLLRTYQAADN